MKTTKRTYRYEGCGTTRLKALVSDGRLYAMYICGNGMAFHMHISPHYPKTAATARKIAKNIADTTNLNVELTIIYDKQ